MVRTASGTVLGDRDLGAYGQPWAPGPVWIRQTDARDGTLAAGGGDRQQPVQGRLRACTTHRTCQTDWLPGLQPRQVAAEGVQVHPDFRQVGDLEQRSTPRDVADVGVACGHHAADRRDKRISAKAVVALD